MSARRLDGKALAAALRDDLAEVVRQWPAGHRPCLAVVAAGADPGSAAYRRSLARQLAALGGELRDELWPETQAPAAARERLAALSADPGVHGILLQVPLPAQLASAALWRALAPAKDVEGSHPENLGRLWLGEDVLRPCTAAAVKLLLAGHRIPLEGRRAVVIGRSPLVGRAIAHVLTEANATVTLAHSRTHDLPALLAEAEVVVAAAGIPGLLQGPELRPDAVVVDVATSVDAAGTLVGDCGPGVAERVAWLSPVPGGVGPLTVAALLANLVRAAQPD